MNETKGRAARPRTPPFFFLYQLAASPVSHRRADEVDRAADLIRNYIHIFLPVNLRADLFFILVVLEHFGITVAAGGDHFADVLAGVFYELAAGGAYRIPVVAL
jgi:hypothetical protein